ncbi:hypothetical protein KC359_g67 [Hortaea werneckii]|nr:hypothetical protein KC359_g67 [Hortaea werneckii]
MDHRFPGKEGLSGRRFHPALSSTLSLLLRLLCRSSRSCCSATAFLLKDIASRVPIFTLPAAATLDVPQSPGVTVARISDVPESIGLAFEEGDHNSTTGREQWHGGFEEADEEFLVEADLSVDVFTLTSDMREVEHHDVVLAALFFQLLVLVKLSGVRAVKHGLSFILKEANMFFRLRLPCSSMMALANEKSPSPTSKMRSSAWNGIVGSGFFAAFGFPEGFCGCGG